mgnify:CR=1 FL=1
MDRRNSIKALVLGTVSAGVVIEACKNAKTTVTEVNMDDRMQEEKDFDHIEPVFFSTSNAGGKAPALAKNETALKDANDIDALKKCDIIISAQGGDYTTEIFPRLRAAGWIGHWIDAASTLRMKDDAVIILDPVNRNVIDKALAAASHRSKELAG